MKPNTRHCYREWPGRKSSRDVLGFEIGSGLGKGRVGSQRHEDARVLEPG